MIGRLRSFQLSMPAKRLWPVGFCWIEIALVSLYKWQGENLFQIEFCIHNRLQIIDLYVTNSPLIKINNFLSLYRPFFVLLSTAGSEWESEVD